MLKEWEVHLTPGTITIKIIMLITELIVPQTTVKMLIFPINFHALQINFPSIHCKENRRQILNLVQNLKGSF